MVVQREGVLMGPSPGTNTSHGPATLEKRDLVTSPD